MLDFGSICRFILPCLVLACLMEERTTEKVLLRSLSSIPEYAVNDDGVYDKDTDK